jgi:cellulose synthase/poly-beta-1,6-N-acetylglucosamine synthase-like glycosyltransferase
VAAPLALEAFALLVGSGALLLSLAGTLHAARWSRAPLVQGARKPFATVIVPCKGEHAGFGANARALAAQDYPAYEALFVVDDKDDPCARALEGLRLGAQVHTVLSEPEVVGDDWATGKIVAQLTGARHASPRSELLVFADADARPGPGWLAALAAPLEDPRIGGATGYRWYHAEGRGSLWTALRDAWNAVGLDAMTMARLRFLWGGSMAVRRADFERSSVRAQWKRHVSEDVGLTRAIQGLGLELAFAPGAMVASPEDWSRRDVLAWVVRQTALTRTSLPAVTRFAWVVYGASAALLVAGLGLVATWPSPALGLAGGLMLTPVAGALPRAGFRARMVRRALPGLAARPRRERMVQLLLTWVIPWFMLWALWRARGVKAITWRGRQYTLPSPHLDR